MAEEAPGATDTPKTVETQAAPSIEGIISEMVMPEGEKPAGEEPVAENAEKEIVLSQDEVEPEASGRRRKSQRIGRAHYRRRSSVSLTSGSARRLRSGNLKRRKEKPQRTPPAMSAAIG